MAVYGVIISISILCAVLVAEHLVEGNSNPLMTKPMLWKVSFHAIIGGIIGARLYHVASSLDFYLSNPIMILHIQNGGLGIWGAVLGGALSLMVYLKIIDSPIIPWLDIGAVVLPLAQATGRWGNYANQELYGIPTSLPWAIYISPNKRLPGMENISFYHPLFLYESILNILLFFVLYRLYTRKNNIKVFKDGDFLAMYLAGYSIIRFFLESLRINAWEIYSLNVSQAISILVLLSTSAYAIYRLRPRGSKIKNQAI